MFKEKIWFEGEFGIITLGELQRGVVGSYKNNRMYSPRNKKWYNDRPCWQTRAQYDELNAKGKLSRERNGSIHNPQRPYSS